MEVYLLGCCPVKNSVLGFTQITIKLPHGPKQLKWNFSFQLFRICAQSTINCPRTGNEGRVQWQKAARYQNRMEQSSGFSLWIDQFTKHSYWEYIFSKLIPTLSPSKYTQAYPIQILQTFKKAVYKQLEPQTRN